MSNDRYASDDEQSVTGKTDDIWVEDARLEVFLEEHKRKCKSLRNTVTNIKKKGRDNYSVPRLQARLDDVTMNWEAAQARHDCIVRAVGLAQRANVEYFQSEFMEELEEVVAETREFIYEEMDKLKSSSAGPAAVAQHQPQQANDNVREHAQRLPEIKIPRYSGDPTTWLNFRDLFTSLVINHPKLSDAQRLQYLHSALEGVALRTIANLEICNANFQVAWEALEKRFAQERVIIKSLMTPILRLKTIRGNDLESIEKVTIDIPQALQALRRWNKTVDYWDLWLVVLITDKFDEQLLQKWEESLQGTEGYPDLDTLFHFLEVKANALRSVGRLKNSGEKKSEVRRERPSERSQKFRSYSHATEVEPVSSRQSCKFCSGSHTLRQCDDFLHQTEQKRFEFAKANAHCIVCLSPDHTGTQCKSNLNCSKCSGRHHTLLHFGSTNSTGISKKGNPSGARGKRYAKSSSASSRSKQDSQPASTSTSAL